MTMFEVGDAVVHPIRGAGVVTDIEELRRDGADKAYYKIELLSQVRTNLMIPVKDAAARGLRRAIRQSKLNRVWRVLRDSPEKLPGDHKKRQELLERKLVSGDLMQVVKAVRDLAWRQHKENGLTATGRRLYRKGINLLAGEVAASQGTDLTDGEAQVRNQLWEVMSAQKRDRPQLRHALGNVIGSVIRGAG
jgi:RNA polymerase-interacting CarD/CdnL/TRCF family regulator